MPVNFTGQAALDAALDRAIEGILGELVERGAEHAQAEARVDTGFYQGHIIGVPPNSPPTPPALEALVDGRGTLRSYYAPGVDGTGKDEALLVAQADYSMWLELSDNTLYNGFNAAVSELGAIAAKYRF